MHLFVTGGRDEIHSKKNIIDNKQPKILRAHYYFKFPSHCRALFHHSYKNKNTPMCVLMKTEDTAMQNR